MNITAALKYIEKLKKFLLEYRSGSNNQELLETIKNMNEDFEGASQFESQVEVRIRKKKRQLEYENEDESPQTPEVSFRINFGHFIGFIE